MLSYMRIKKRSCALKKHIFYSLIIFNLICIKTKTNGLQSLDVSDLKYKISGYIKYESYFDTRQVFGVSNDQFLVFPEKKQLDPNGNDINSRGQGQMVAIESRMRTTVSGIKINKAESTGIIEADFFGRFTGPFAVSNIFRLRLAYMQLDWEKLTLQLGQTWHPLAVLQCYADTISFSNGNPIEIYSRSPLIKTIYHGHNFDFIASASTQLDFTSDGPEGFSTKYIRDAIIPSLHAQIQGRFGAHVAGSGIDYKRLRPRIVTNDDFKTSESINSIAAIWYLALNFPSVVFRTKVSFGQNAHDYGMIGGYAVHTIDSTTDERTYTNIRAISAWIDLAVVKNKKIEPGLFIGYVKNLGASKPITLDLVDNNKNVLERRIFGFGNDTDYVFRISPRIRWRIHNLTVAGELEFTRAAFGIIDNNGKVKNTNPANNTRLLLAAYYYF